jgi:hypothetical protein
VEFELGGGGRLHRRAPQPVRTQDLKFIWRRLLTFLAAVIQDGDLFKERKVLVSTRQIVRKQKQKRHSAILPMQSSHLVF